MFITYANALSNSILDTDSDCDLSARTFRTQTICRKLPKTRDIWRSVIFPTRVKSFLQNSNLLLSDFGKIYNFERLKKKFNFNFFCQPSFQAELRFLTDLKNTTRSRSSADPKKKENRFKMTIEKGNRFFSGGLRLIVKYSIQNKILLFSNQT